MGESGVITLWRVTGLRDVEWLSRQENNVAVGSA